MRWMNHHHTRAYLYPTRGRHTSSSRIENPRPTLSLGSRRRFISAAHYAALSVWVVFYDIVRLLRTCSPAIPGSFQAEAQKFIVVVDWLAPAASTRRWETLHDTCGICGAITTGHDFERLAQIMRAQR